MRSPPAARPATTTRRSASPRGAWESVKRHFRELGVDTQADPFTVVGIGDMSGDVFGSGMSDKIRLVAAYDHRHVFIDPTRIERGFAGGGGCSSCRLVLGRYDRELISRAAASTRAREGVKLPRRRGGARHQRRGAAADHVIRAILRAPVDLLWNGGIGTVVKASTESDEDAPTARRTPSA